MAKKKREVPEIRRILGIFDNILATLFRKMDKKDLTEEDFHRLSTPEGEVILDKLVEFMVEQFGKAEKVFTAVVNYGRSLKKKTTALRKSGKLTGINDGILEYELDEKLSVGPTTQTGKKNLCFKLFRFGRTVSSEEARREMEKEGYYPALPTQGADFLEENFEEVEALRQEESDKTLLIAMLSSVFVSPGGDCHVACFHLVGTRRVLDLSWFGHDWYDDWFFLGVCED